MQHKTDFMGRNYFFLFSAGRPMSIIINNSDNSILGFRFKLRRFLWNIVQNSSFWFNHNLVNFECFWGTQITISLDLEVTLVIKSLKTIHHYIWVVQIFHSSLAINWIYLLMWYKVVSGDWVVWFCFCFCGEKKSHCCSRYQYL